MQTMLDPVFCILMPVIFFHGKLLLRALSHRRIVGQFIRGESVKITYTCGNSAPLCNWKLNPLAGVTLDGFVSGFAIVITLAQELKTINQTKLGIYIVYLVLFFFCSWVFHQWSEEPHKLRWEVLGGNIVFGASVWFALMFLEITWKDIPYLAFLYDWTGLEFPWLVLLLYCSATLLGAAMILIYRTVK